MKLLVVPIINMNGNTADSLLDQLRGVMLSLSNAERAMAEASDVWHGRNFQTLKNGESISREAREAWHEQMRLVGQIHNNVLVLARDILKQKHERDERLGSIDHMTDDASPAGWDVVEGGPVVEGPWHTVDYEDDRGMVMVGHLGNLAIAFHQGTVDERMRTACQVVDLLNKANAGHVLTNPDDHPLNHGAEAPNDTQPLGVVMNETHAEGDDAPLGPKTGDE